MNRHTNRRRSAFGHALAGGVAGCLCLTLATVPVDAAKRKSGPVKPPDLRIVSLNVSPTAFSPQDGNLTFAVEVELPKELDGMLLLEVSSLISSPSQRSMRFLSSRQPVDHQGEVSAAESGSHETKRRVGIKLIWDGMDQSKQAVPKGTYSYEVRAKLLTVGNSGPRTHMVSWPKRGSFVVK